MERRKITSQGKYSLVITLPKEWVRMNNLGSGDSVSIRVRGDGSLVVHPSLDVKERPREVSLFFRADEEPNSIIRSVIGCYLNGYNTIRLTSGRNFTVEQQAAIRSVVRSLYMRILESTARRVILQTFMDESLASVVSGIERMHIITNSMCKDVLKSMREWDDGLAKSVLSLEEDVDQFMYFLIRLTRSAVMSPSLASGLGITMSDCFDYHLLINRIEYVADHAASIAQKIITLKERQMDMPERFFASIIRAAEKTFASYDLAVEAFLSGNMEHTNEIIDERDEVERLEEEISPLPYYGEHEKTITYHLFSIIDSIKRISEYAGDIAEITIDRHFMPGE